MWVVFTPLSSGTILRWGPSVYLPVGTHTHMHTQIRTQLFLITVWGYLRVNLYSFLKPNIYQVYWTPAICLTLAWARLAKRNRMWPFSWKCSRSSDSHVNNVASAVIVIVWSAVDRSERHNLILPIQVFKCLDSITSYLVLMHFWQATL